MDQHIVTESIIVKGDVSTIYAVWSDFGNLPRFMKRIKSVSRTGDRTGHFVMSDPLSKTLEWDAEFTRLERNRRVAWRSVQGGDLTTSGQVILTPLPHDETAVTVTLQYSPQPDHTGEHTVRLFSDPKGQLAADLRRFKGYIERGTHWLS
jgi:uncharacterized membrane protein